jgi:4-oxalocrotonate tautomerase family enzyme
VAAHENVKARLALRMARRDNVTGPNNVQGEQMPVIQCDIREGWSDEQKRALAKGITNVVAEVGKVPVKSVHVVIREGRGLHFMFGGESIPEYRPPNPAETKSG